MFHRLWNLFPYGTHTAQFYLSRSPAASIYRRCICLRCLSFSVEHISYSTSHHCSKGKQSRIEKTEEDEWIHQLLCQLSQVDRKVVICCKRNLMEIPDSFAILPQILQMFWLILRAIMTVTVHINTDDV